MTERILYRSLFGFLFLTGMSLVTTMVVFLYHPAVMFQALAVTMVIYIGTACFGFFTKKNLLGWGGPLFGALLALIFVGFFQIFFENPLLNLVVTLIDILVFTLYIMYDNQVIKVRFLLKYRDDIPDTLGSWWSLALDGALDIYLDFINLFLDILSLLGDDDD